MNVQANLSAFSFLSSFFLLSDPCLPCRHMGRHRSMNGTEKAHMFCFLDCPKVLRLFHGREGGSHSVFSHIIYSPHAFESLTEGGWIHVCSCLLPKEVSREEKGGSLPSIIPSPPPERKQVKAHVTPTGASLLRGSSPLPAHPSSLSPERQAGKA